MGKYRPQSGADADRFCSHGLRRWSPLVVKRPNGFVRMHATVFLQSLPEHAGVPTTDAGSIARRKAPFSAECNRGIVPDYAACGSYGTPAAAGGWPRPVRRASTSMVATYGVIPRN